MHPAAPSRDGNHTCAAAAFRGRNILHPLAPAAVPLQGNDKGPGSLTMLPRSPACTPASAEDLSGEVLAPAAAELMNGFSAEAGQLALGRAREAAQLP